jgi:putative membrane protein
MLVSCSGLGGHELTSRMYISAWVTDLNNRNILNVSFASPIMTCIMELQKALSDLDKLATTPIPTAYSFHLRMTVLLYLFFLPFQLQQYLNWVAIPATAIASIVYLGFLEIGNQIEMPFAYDQSDLDLDKYVLKIAMQLAEITAVSSPTLIVWN